jgi:hypothetical protein
MGTSKRVAQMPKRTENERETQALKRESVKRYKKERKMQLPMVDLSQTKNMMDHEVNIPPPYQVHAMQQSVVIVPIRNHKMTRKRHLQVMDSCTRSNILLRSMRNGMQVLAKPYAVKKTAGC